jgi:uncharacterized membrane protein
MRTLVLAVAVSSLALAACGKKGATGNTSAVDTDVSAEDFATNDATAIDAATGADANMAADVDINVYENAGEDSDRPASSNASRTRRAPASGNSSGNVSQPAPAPEPIEPAPTSNAG